MLRLSLYISNYECCYYNYECFLIFWSQLQFKLEDGENIKFIYFEYYDLKKFIYVIKGFNIISYQIYDYM